MWFIHVAFAITCSGILLRLCRGVTISFPTLIVYVGKSSIMRVTRYDDPALYPCSVVASIIKCPRVYKQRYNCSSLIKEANRGPFMGYTHFTF